VTVRSSDRMENPGAAGLLVRESEATDTDAVGALMLEYLEWAIQRLRAEYGVVWPPVDRATTRTYVENIRRPEGALIVAELNDRLVGIGAFHRLEPGVAEIKRMYVVPTARGRHVGSAVLDRLLREAELDGNQVIRLDTLKFMSDAQRLYRSRGFRERSPYPGTEIPNDLHRHWLFFERSGRL